MQASEGWLQSPMASAACERQFVDRVCNDLASGRFESSLRERDARPDRDWSDDTDIVGPAQAGELAQHGGPRCEIVDAIAVDFHSKSRTIEWYRDHAVRRHCPLWRHDVALPVSRTR